MYVLNYTNANLYKKYISAPIFQHKKYIFKNPGRYAFLNKLAVSRT